MTARLKGLPPPRPIPDGRNVGHFRSHRFVMCPCGTGPPHYLRAGHNGQKTSIPTAQNPT